MITHWKFVKTQRDFLLKKSEWTQLADAHLTAEQKTAWNAYRATLYDIEKTYANAEDVIFPVAPTGGMTDGDAQTEQIFNLPVRAPQIIAEEFVQAADYLLLTPDIDKDPLKAHKQAMDEFDKGKGGAKSLGTMVMANTFVIDALLKRIEALEKK